MARGSSKAAAARPRDGDSPFAGLAVLLWVIATLAFLGSTVIFVAPYRPVFESLEVEIPGLTMLLCDLSAWVQTPIGMLATIAAIAATTAPYFAGARGHKASRRYLWAAVVLFVLGAGSYFAAQLPIQKLAEKLGTEPTLAPAHAPR